MPIDKNVDVKTLDQQKLLFYHMQTHQLWRKYKEQGSVEGWSKEDIWNLHKLVIEEMQRRGLNHNIKDDLDETKIGQDEGPDLQKKLKLSGIEYKEV